MTERIAALEADNKRLRNILKYVLDTWDDRDLGDTGEIFHRRAIDDARIALATRS